MFESFFSFGRYVNEFIQIKYTFFSNEAHFSCETVSVLCYSHQACCILCCLPEINNGIHIYQFTFKSLHFCFPIWLWFRMWIKSRSTDLAKERHGSDLHIPLCLIRPLFLGWHDVCIQPLYNDVPSITNCFPRPSNGKLLGKKPRYNKTLLGKSLCPSLHRGPGGGGYSIYPLVGRCGRAPHTLTLFKTNIADFPTLFKTEFRFLIPCLRHLTRILINKSL